MKERNIVMLTHPTLDQMQTLGLAGMAAAYRQLAEQDQGADLRHQQERAADQDKRQERRSHHQYLSCF